MEIVDKEILPKQGVNNRKRPVFTIKKNGLLIEPEIKYILTRKKEWMDIPIDKKTTYTPEQRKEFAEMKERQKELREKMKEVDLEAVFIKLNGERISKGKWSIPDFGKVINQGQRWEGVSETQGKGFGGSDFVKLHFGFQFEMEALTWMVENFGENIDESLKVDLTKLEERNDFNPPDKAPQFTHIGETYLIEKRGLPPSLIRELVNTNKLYVDDSKRCIFLAEASAEVRSTHESYIEFKGAVEGSQVDLSGFTILPELNISERVIGKVEAAVDAISYRALFPGRFVLSTNGAGRYELQYKTSVEAVDNGYGVSLGYDADDAGDLAAQREFNSFYLREKLSKELNIEKEIIDEWLLQGYIRLNIDISNHHLYLKNGWEDEKSVSIKKTRQEADPEKEGRMKTIHYWELTDEMKAPELTYTISRDLADGKLLRGQYTIPVNKRAVEYIEKHLGVKRDRPVVGKDWNNELNTLGSSYIRDYEKCAANGFKKLPKLPKHLEEMKRAINPVIIGEALNNNIEERKVEVQKENTINNVESKKSEVIKENNVDVFTTDLSRQEIFNSLYIRFNINKKINIGFDILDEQLRNKKIEFNISSSPHLSFCDEPYEAEKPVLYEDEGHLVTSGEYSPPLINVVFHEGLGDKIPAGKKVNFKVSKEGFDFVIKYMDKMADYLDKSKDWKGALSRMNAGFIVPVESDKETLKDVLGNGTLLKDLENKKIETYNDEYTDIGMSDDSYGAMLEMYTQLDSSSDENTPRKHQMK